MPHSEPAAAAAARRILDTDGAMSPSAAPTLQRCRRAAAERLPAPEGRRALGAEATALYLAHTALGVPLRRLAAASGRAPSTVLRAVRRVEARRDDPLLDAVLQEIEGAARTLGAEAPFSMEVALPATRFEAVRPRSAPAGASAEAGAPGSGAAGRPTEAAVEKEARRILRRLGEPRAILALARGAEVAAVFRRAESGDGYVTLARTPVAFAREFAARDWIECVHLGGAMARYELSSVGRAWLKRTLAEDGERRRRAAEDRADAFRRQHVEAGERVFAGPEGEPERRAVNLGETPLGWLARRKGADGAPFLKPEEVAAGERLREDFEAAQMGPRIAQDWRRFLTAGVSGGRGGRGPAEGPADARRRVAEALAALGPGLEDAALRACCFLEGLEATERRMGWSARSGKVVLKIALGRLAEHYGFARCAAPHAAPAPQSDAA